MPETELTKRIKKLTHYYSPKLNSKMRTIRWADEVWTPTGIVDSIRFEDYYEKEEYICKLIDSDRFSDTINQTTAHFHKLGKCFRDGSKDKDNKKCHGCFYRSHLWSVGMIITCFEVKITYADFRSENGHNFHGNENYYCVPKELAPKIIDEVPKDIGILVYYEGKNGYGIRKYKASGWREVPDKTKILL